jgi:hypothetical protein
MRGFSVFAAVLLFTMQSPAQESRESRDFFGNLSAEQLNLISESRRAARKELDEKAAAFDTPGIASALGFPSYLIAIARITAVKLPDDTTPRTRVTFHVEQYLRGESNLAEFDVESRWVPKSSVSDEGPLYRKTALDESEPKTGHRYILGYTLDYSDGEPVFALGVVDLQDPAQAELIGNIRRFLAMDTEASLNGFETYLELLDDKIPWIRDIAVHWLTESDSCNASPICAERFSVAVRRQLQSDTPNERQEAVSWLVWVDSVSSAGKRYLEGLPVLPDSALRVLFNAAIQDRNVVIGDEAFEYREMFEMRRSGSPGECFVIVPPLRKSLRMRSQAQPPLRPNFPFTYSYGCLPKQ